jgi:hypothetical protein
MRGYLRTAAVFHARLSPLTRRGFGSRCRSMFRAAFSFRGLSQIGNEIEQAAAPADDPSVRPSGADRDYDWVAIRHAVIHSDWSLDRIAEEYGPHATTIGVRARQGGWTRLVGTAPLTTGRKPPPLGAKRGGRPPAAEVRRRRFVRRMFQVLDAKLGEMEARMEAAFREGVTQSAADTERDMRSVNQFMQIYAKLVALDEEARGLSKTGSESLKGAMDAEEFRRDLALRIRKLNQDGET